MHKEIEVGEIIAKFDISGRDRSWQDYRQIRYLAEFGRLVNIEFTWQEHLLYLSKQLYNPQQILSNSSFIKIIAKLTPAGQNLQ